MKAQDAASERERPGMPAVLRSANFVRLWFSEVTRSLGSGMKAPAISLVSVATLHASPGQMGLLTFLGSVPSTILDLFAGVFADRIPRRTLIIVGFLISCAAMAFLAVAFLAGHLQFWMVLVGAAVDGCGYSVALIARSSYLPMILKRERLVEANSALFIANSVAGLVAPSISGIVVQFAGAPLALATVSCAFVVSAIVARTIPEVGAVEGRAWGPKASALLLDIRDGLVWLWRDQLMRQLSVRVGAWYFIVGGLLSLDILYVINALGATPTQVGMFYSITAGAGLVGSALAIPMSRWLGVGKTIVLTNLTVACGAALIPAASGHSFGSIALAAAAYAIFGALGSVYSIANSSIRQAVVPSEVLGRVTGATYVLADGAASVGALVIGGLGSLIGARGAIAAVVAAGIAFSVVGTRNRKLWNLRSLAAGEGT